MTQYENEFSSFPSKKITRHHFKNIDDAASGIIHQINQLRAQGAYSQAAALLEAHRETLSPYIVDAVTFRTWEEEIYNTQKYAKQISQAIFFEENQEDFECLEGDVWVGGV